MPSKTLIRLLKVKCASVTVPAFSGSVGGSQSVTVSGITTSDNPILDVLIEDVANVDAYNEAWSKVYRATTSAANTITLYYSDTSAASFKMSVKW